MTNEEDRADTGPVRLGAQDERPLVTFALIAYNQERYIREAAEAALAQTYSPLQIIFSDDCSTDQTASILDAIVSEYSGPHQVRVYRNAGNLGTGAHLNKVFSYACGELIVLAAGDDISLPLRTDRVVSEWLGRGKPAGVSSSFDLIAADGSPVDGGAAVFRHCLPRLGESRSDMLVRLVRTGTPCAVGPAQAWSRPFIESFPLIPEDVLFEDKVLSFRCWMFGEICYIRDSLVKYRQHDKNVFNLAKSSALGYAVLKRKELNRQITASRDLAALRSHLSDLLVNETQRLPFLTEVPPKVLANLVNVIINESHDADIRANWWSLTVIGKAKLFYIDHEFRSRNLKWMIPRLLPLSLLTLLRVLKAVLFTRRAIK